EITVTAYAMVLGHAQMQHHQLIALTGVFESTPIRGLDSDLRACTMHTVGPLSRRGPNVNILSTLDFLYDQTRDSQDRIDGGHRHCFLLDVVLRKNKSNKCRCPPFMMKSPTPSTGDRHLSDAITPFRPH